MDAARPNVAPAAAMPAGRDERASTMPTPNAGADARWVASATGERRMAAEVTSSRAASSADMGRLAMGERAPSPVAVPYRAAGGGGGAPPGVGGVGGWLGGGGAGGGDAAAPTPPAGTLSASGESASQGERQGTPDRRQDSSGRSAAARMSEAGPRSAFPAAGEAAPFGKPEAVKAAPADTFTQAHATTRMGGEDALHRAAAPEARAQEARAPEVKASGDPAPRQEGAPRAGGRAEASTPTDGARAPSAKAAATPSEFQARSAGAEPAQPHRSAAAEPSQGMRSLGGEPTADTRREPASMTPSTASAGERPLRQDQAPRATERQGASLDDVARSASAKPASSPAQRAEDGTFAATRQGMLAPATTQVANVLTSALVQLKQDANAPVGAERTRLRAGGAALKTIQIQLAPEDLGKVNVTLKLIGDNLTVHIEASEPETAHRLKDDGEGLKSLLKSAGFDVDEAVVTVGARDTAGTRGPQQTAPQGDASASANNRSDGSAGGQFASDGQAGQGARRDDGRPRQGQSAIGAGAFDGASEAGGRTMTLDPSIYL